MNFASVVVGKNEEVMPRLGIAFKSCLIRKEVTALLHNRLTPETCSLMQQTFNGKYYHQGSSTSSLDCISKQKGHKSQGNRMFDLRVLRTIRSCGSSSKYLSLVSIVLSVQTISCLKSFFGLQGHPVVGNGSHCKPLRHSSKNLGKRYSANAKGTYLACTKLSLPIPTQSPEHQDLELSGAVCLPPKFSTLCEREEAAWLKLTSKRYSQLRGSAYGAVLPEMEAKKLSENLETDLDVYLGETHFRGLKLAVTGDVFVSKGSSAALVETLLKTITQRIASCDTQEKLTILDIGCGSGNLSLAAADALLSMQKASPDPGTLPHFDIFGIDVNPAAVELSQRNAVSLGMSERCTFLEGDIFKPADVSHLVSKLNGQQVDYIICNPPYLPQSRSSSFLHTMQAPQIAVNGGGREGLDFYKQLAAALREGQLQDLLKPNAMLIVEIPGTGETTLLRPSSISLKVREMFEKVGISWLEVGVRDAHELYRCLVFNLTAQPEKTK